VAYLLSYASFLPVFGRLCEMYGRKLLFLAGFTIFTVASLLCGFATGLEWLVVFRVLQGMGGALLGANSISILVTSVDDERRPHAIGFFTTAQAVGVSAGPAVGGVLLNALGWQWVFWVAVPFSLVAAIAGWFILPPTKVTAINKRFDPLGALLLVPALVLAVLVLNQVSVWPVLSPPMLLSMAGAAFLLFLFVHRERVAPSPLLDLALFRHRPFAAGMTAVMLGYGLLFGMFFLMSFALLHGYHQSPQDAGFKLAVIPIALGLTAPWGIKLGKKVGNRAICIAGMILVASALTVIAVLAEHPFGHLVSGLSAFAVFGIGLGLYMAPNNHATLDSAPASHAGQAAALLNLFRVLGSCVGVSAASSVMSWRMARLDAFFGGHPMINAAESSLLLLLAFALVAIGAVALRTPKPAVA
jgi:EmrB/QacA subfamily drug resistance transporter